MNTVFKTTRAVLASLLLLAGCDYARMTDDAAYDTYETHLPRMPAGSMPLSGGSAALRLMGPEALQNPLEAGEALFAQGRRSYGFFCVHCHGPQGKGPATVGQSFAPLPTDLTSRRVQTQSDGALFYKIVFGYQRHPPLVDTMTERDVWAVVGYLRSSHFTEAAK